MASQEPTLIERIDWAARTIYALRAIPFKELIKLSHQELERHFDPDDPDYPTVSQETMMLLQAMSAVGIARHLLGISKEDDEEVRSAPNM
jgi:hypothetical protein